VGKGILWWIAEFILYGIAYSILQDLQYEVAAKRERWENLYESLEREVEEQQDLLEEEIERTEKYVSFKQISLLHSQSIELADRVYSLLEDSRETLNAMGNAIVNAAKQRKILQQKKREASYSEKASIQEEIDGLIELRDDILIPDKDTVKEQRNSLLRKVKELNKQTAQLRELKNGLRSEERQNRTKTRQIRCHGSVKFYDRKKHFGFIKTDSCNSDVYVNVKQLRNVEILNKGDHVTFILMSSDKPWASQVDVCKSHSS